MKVIKAFVCNFFGAPKTTTTTTTTATTDQWEKGKPNTNNIASLSPPPAKPLTKSLWGRLQDLVSLVKKTLLFIFTKISSYKCSDKSKIISVKENTLSNNQTVAEKVGKNTDQDVIALFDDWYGIIKNKP